VAAEGQEARLVALDERLERAVLAAADEDDQLLVALESEQRRTTCQSRQACCGSVVESGGFQDGAVSLLTYRHGNSG
jgi:hypothetical protein